MRAGVAAALWGAALSVSALEHPHANALLPSANDLHLQAMFLEEVNHDDLAKRIERVAEAESISPTSLAPAPSHARPSNAGYVAMIIGHLPLLGILIFLFLGILERVGFLFNGRELVQDGKLPDELPLVCVQLSMYNENAVAERIIAAACAMNWPRDKLEVQVLDDSTDPAAREIVDNAVEREAAVGTNCVVIRREKREGYKAGALENGRKLTEAKFLVLFDADFLPSEDYIQRSGNQYVATPSAAVTTSVTSGPYQLLAVPIEKLSTLTTRKLHHSVRVFDPHVDDPIPPLSFPRSLTLLRYQWRGAC